MHHVCVKLIFIEELKLTGLIGQVAAHLTAAVWHLYGLKSMLYLFDTHVPK